MTSRKSLQLDDGGEEDEWNQSAASKKRPNLFDDAISFDAMKKALSNQPLGLDGEFEEGDVINFDGTPATSNAKTTDYQSARYRPSSSQVGGSVGSARVAPDAPSLSGPPQASRNAVPRASIGGLPVSHSQPSIEDVVGSESPRRPPTLTDMAKLESEILFLKRSLAAAKGQDLAKIPPADTVRRMVFGQPYSLERYRSKEDKLLLLDETIAKHDGNAIIAAVLFLRDTIKPTIFNLELQRRPVAVEHYISYLRQYCETEKLIDLLGMLGRSEEAAMLRYKQAIASRQIDTKLRSIQTCHQAHFQFNPSLGLDAALVSEHIRLLERQLPIETADAQEAAKATPMFKQLPRAGSILDMPVITTLFYCCLYHYALAENYLASPSAIKKAHALTEKQFQWTVVRARGGVLKRWQEIEALFTTKSWLGLKVKGAMAFERLVPILRKNDAPREVIKKYCDLIENVDTRLEVGQKYGCHESVIDTYMGLKDRLQLMAYQNKLNRNSQEWFYATDVLKTSTIKWKN